MAMGIVNCPSCGRQKESELIALTIKRGGDKTYSRIYKCNTCGTQIKRDMGVWRK